MKKKAILAAAAVLILFSALCAFAMHPPVLCSVDIPQQYMDAIRADVQGVYSPRLPLVPFFVTVDSYTEGSVAYTIFYFPFGTVGMEYIEGDGYSVEKSLTGW